MDHGETTGAGSFHLVLKLPPAGDTHHFHSHFIGQSNGCLANAKQWVGKCYPLWEDWKTRQFMDIALTTSTMRLLALQLALYITITSIRPLLLEFFSLYLVEFHAPIGPGRHTQSSFPSHQAQLLEVPTERE